MSWSLEKFQRAMKPRELKLFDTLGYTGHCQWLKNPDNPNLEFITLATTKGWEF